VPPPTQIWLIITSASHLGFPSSESPGGWFRFYVYHQGFWRHLFLDLFGKLDPFYNVEVRYNFAQSPGKQVNWLKVKKRKYVVFYLFMMTATKTSRPALKPTLAAMLSVTHRSDVAKSGRMK